MRRAAEAMRENGLISTDQNDGVRKQDTFRQDKRNANREIHPANTAGWLSRGYLPHFESVEATQHVTFHLADSVPKDVARRLESELTFLPDRQREVERRKRLDTLADAGYGSCVLREAHIASMIQESLLKFDVERYRLLAWVIMPNHVHVLFQPLNGWTVAKIVASWKKFSARAICNWRTQNGQTARDPVWHREYWDRYMRDAKHLAKAIEYIHMNPVKVGLVDRDEDWRWSSVHITKGKVDGSPTGDELQMRGTG